jgi:GNAT superfamily N-acetyltransferase
MGKLLNLPIFDPLVHAHPMTEPGPIHYAHEPALTSAEFRRVLVESGLGPSRPIDDDRRLLDMLSAADLVLTARAGDADGPLLGIARGLTDFTWCCYISELAVCASAQGLRIGQGLLSHARQRLGPTVSIILISVPDAVGFYEHAGMEHVPDAFWYHRQ